MKRILFDTNIILDIALKRYPFFNDAFKLFELIDEKKITGSITATTVTDIYFISKKEKGHLEAIQFINNLIKVVDVIGVDKEVIVNALFLKIFDFEDAVQISAAEFNEINTIITRNKSDFVNTAIQILTPVEFLDLLA